MRTQLQEYDPGKNCYLCFGPLVNGECPSYHWHDAVHLRARAIAKGEQSIDLIPEGIDPELIWPEIFHTKREAENAPPVEFLIDGFLQREGVTAIAAPVRERKSLIALNIAHALVTREKLFGRFEVLKRAEVVYLCPEVSLGPFTDRIKKIGLLSYVGDWFHYRTMSAKGHLRLNDPRLLQACKSSVVILDTFIRFLEGDESSSKDVRKFADDVFSLLKAGAQAVILLHHSPKEMGDRDHMTLETCLRGSGDIGAFVSTCYGTKLQDPADPYKSKSFLSNLKQRDFESRDFEVTCDEDCRMHYVEGLTVPVIERRNKFKGNRDGLDDAANTFLKTHPELSLRDAAAGLQQLGIKRSKDWVSRARFRLQGDGVSQPKPECTHHTP